MTPLHQITMLKFIKNLSMLSTTLDNLHSANAIELLIDLLNSSMKKAPTHFREISNQVLNTMYNLCRLSKVRQEDAATNGIIPLLQKIMKTKRPPKEFALPILCDMAHSGKVARKYLWQNKGLQFYVSLLEDQYWQVTALDAIFIWCVNCSISIQLAKNNSRLQEETAKVEKFLLEGNFTEAIVQCFNAPKASAFDYNLLEPLQKLLRLSSPVAASLTRPDMFTGILQKLNHKKAVVRLNLLRIVRSICDPNEDLADSLRNHSLFEAIRRLAENDNAVLVRNMAGELVKYNLDKDQESGSGGRPRPGQIARRTSSYTPPSLHQSASTPITPTHASRSLASSAFIDGSVTPRRMAVPPANGDSILYRPRSRDGSQISVRRTSSELASGTPVSKSRLPRTSMLRTSRSSMAALTMKDNSSSSLRDPSIRRDNGGRHKDPSNSVASSASGGTAPQLSSKRRTRQPSGEIKWS